MAERVDQMSTSLDACAPCKAGESLRWSLTNAADIIREQFRLSSDIAPLRGPCVGYRTVWDSFVSSAIEEKKEIKQRKKLEATFKGTKVLFDTICSSCDGPAREAARTKWQKLSGDSGVEGIPTWKIDALKSRVKILVDGWGRKLKGSKEEFPEPSSLMKKRKKMGYVADQQGCLETEKRLGGTLATDDRSGEVNVVRVGMAKTKGKWRTVTMQSAYVKRVLRPVHEALYNHLSGFDWLVRGDVKSSHFRDAVRGMVEGEDIISGDYESATDNIYLQVVQMIVDVIAEAGEKEMTDEERSVLVGSFRDLKWKSKSGKLHRILRGSMMGNLVSFPILCILNKACFDLTSDYFHDPEERRERFGRFNGDDCIFTGDKNFFSKWVEVTGWFGLKVNVTKTGTSSRFGELNSNCYDFLRSRFIAKPCLGFLRKTSEPGEILTGVLNGIKSFRPEVQLRIVNVIMRYEISVKGVCANSIPILSGHHKGWLNVLLKRKWFRRAIEVGPVAVKEQKLVAIDKRDPSCYRFINLPRAEKRVVEVTQGPLPKEKYYEVIEQLTAEYSQVNQDYWRGKIVNPFEYKISRKKCYDLYNKKTELKEGKWVLKDAEFKWLWPKELLSIVEEKYPWILQVEESETCLYHPFIGVTSEIAFEPWPVDLKSLVQYAPPLSLTKKEKPSFLSFFQPPVKPLSRFKEAFLASYVPMYERKAVLRSESLW
ncbi:RNA-dependent RNA polymerase [Botrytis cinerea ourmia-like virus 13]|uniref:RNA-dependent RNA polymerase n=1 Tax=Botrytis cinerea ourmia-like virus 13 TaxID=2735947 RepID=A0ABX6P118_9VIRU|nr:RNA-dependent RNA polymerase [Botrytis cinerea ourmia-like virus 13]QJT73679.1 RNA-dependent RNA polymerase [Botrytis cinerea ourmia-like virus 13]